MMKLERQYYAQYQAIAKAANAKPKPRVSLPKTITLINNKSLSVSSKKKKLITQLKALTLTCFKGLHHSRTAKDLKQSQQQLHVLKLLVHKLKSVITYQETSFLKELKIISHIPTVKAAQKKQSESQLRREQKQLPKKYLDQLEYSVYHFLKTIVAFDQKLIEQYQHKNIILVGNQKLGKKDLKHVLEVQSHLIDMLDAKIPPASRVSKKLLQGKTLAQWTSSVYALLAGLAAEYQRERLIVTKLRASQQVKKKLDKKISTIIKEKNKLLAIQEKKALQLQQSSQMNHELRNVFHDYVSAAYL